VVTMDALHAQRDHAACLVEQRHAHYLVTVKGKPAEPAETAASPALGPGPGGAPQPRRRPRP
jgi:hypothetical protein